jgi:RNA polymerase sigma-70 factor (ECF subfamily)
MTRRVASSLGSPPALGPDAPTAAGTGARNPILPTCVRDAVQCWGLTHRSRVEERELIGRVLAGDPSAERALYDAHVDRVFRLVYRMAGDLDRAQDYTQETFIRAFSRLGDFRGEAALSTWLGSIAISVTLNGLRRVRRRQEREVALDDVVPVGRVPREAEPDLKTRLTQAIDDLPEGYRAVFVMHDVEGFTHEEIATSLGVHPGTSKAQLFRARARLREALADFAKD